MTHRLLVQYGQPTDPAAFDQHYRDVHVGLAQKIPGLLRFSYGHPKAVGGGEAPYLVAELDFESAEAFGASMSTPEGAATGQDVGNFATGGATMSSYDLEEASA